MLYPQRKDGFCDDCAGAVPCLSGISVTFSFFILNFSLGRAWTFREAGGKRAEGRRSVFETVFISRL